MTVTSVTSGHKVSNVVVSSGNELLVLAGGSAVATTALGQGEQVVSGGTVSGGVISSGGQQFLEGGVAVSTRIFGGSETILAGSDSSAVLTSF